MKKILLLSVPLLLFGALMTNKGPDANYADFDYASIRPELLEQSNEYSIRPGLYDKVSFDKSGLLVANLPITVQDPTLQKDYPNEQAIQNNKGRFGSTIGRGVNIADASPFAFKNNDKNANNVDIFKTSFLNDLYPYGRFTDLDETEYDSIYSKNTQSLSTSIKTGLTVSTGIKASYASVTAEVSNEVGFSVEFSNSFSNSSAVYNYNWLHKTYSYNLPQFDKHVELYKNNLTDTFKNDISNALIIDSYDKYVELFETYGSHVIMAADYGGASTVFASIISSEISTSVTTEESIETTVAAGLEANGYGVTASVGVGTSLAQSMGISDSFARETFKGHFYGGREVAGANSLASILSNARSWTSTVNDRNVLVTYKNVTPIWNLLTGSLNTSANIEKLEDAFDQYCIERENYYINEAKAVQFASNLNAKHQALGLGEEFEVVGYWDAAHTNYHNQISLGNKKFFDLNALKENGFNAVKVDLKFTARATTDNTKIRAKVSIGGHDSGYGGYITLEKNKVKTINYDSYESPIFDIMHLDSNLHVELEANDGEGALWWLKNRRVFVSNVYFDITYIKAENRGTGTPTDPYRIYDADDFKLIKNDLNAHYRVMNDINFAYGSWEPIKGSFNGTLHGDNYTLTNFRIEKTITSNSWGQYGLFESLGTNSHIENLKFEKSRINIQISGSITPTIYAGLICGIQNGGTIEHVVFNETDVKMTSAFGLVGTAAGYIRGVIKNSEFNGIKVYGCDVVGGVTGTLDFGARAYHCQVVKSASGVKPQIELSAKDYSTASYRCGGIAGYNFRSEVSNCKVSDASFRLTGSVTYKPAIGAVIGHLNGGTISGCTASFIEKYNANSSYTTYYFAYQNGNVGRVE